jgi:hypothetical protein
MCLPFPDLPSTDTVESVHVPARQITIRSCACPSHEASKNHVRSIWLWICFIVYVPSCHDTPPATRSTTPRLPCGTRRWGWRR